MTAACASQAAIQKETAQMASMGELYKNPVFNILITYCIIFPVGLAVTLIAAAALRKKPGQLVETK